MKKNKILRLILIITFCLIFVDQICKFVIQYTYTRPLGNDWFGIILIQNTGMAFGINSGNVKNIILTTIILLIVINFIKNGAPLYEMVTAHFNMKVMAAFDAGIRSCETGMIENTTDPFQF